MKKKLLCMALVVCAVLALVPALLAPATADSAASAANPTTEADYMALYVEDGLEIWLDAFDANNEKIDLAAGTWASEKGDAVATITGGVFGADNPMGWQKGEKGGIYWTQRAAVSHKVQANGIYFDPSLIPEKDFTVEMMISADGITNDDGTRWTSVFEETGYTYGVGAGEGFAVGVFRSYTYYALCTKDGKATSDQLGNRWYYTGMIYTNHYNSFSSKRGKILTNGEGGFRAVAAGELFKMTMRMEYTTDSSVLMSVHYNDKANVQQEYKESSLGWFLANNDGYNAKNEPVADNVRFQLMRGMPGKIYNIRVYSRALSEEEQVQNTFADIVRYVKADLSVYKAMADEVKAVAHEEVVAMGYNANKAEIEACFAAAQKAYEDKLAKEEAEAAKRAELLEKVKDRDFNAYDKYYVQDGLVFFLDAFVGLPEWNKSISLTADENGNGAWTSKTGGTVAKIGGAKYWKEGADGKGIGFSFTKEQYKLSLEDGICPAGLEFGAEYLTETVTVETVAKIVGISDSNGNRYIDPPSSGDRYGIYTAKYSAFSFGALKTMTFLCESEATYGTPMGHRWCFNQKEWSDHNGSGVSYKEDKTIQDIDWRNPIAYTIVKNEPNATTTVGQVYINNVSKFEARYNTVPDPEPEFHIYKGLASTLYAVRVYNRTLTPDERAQNHVADLMSYYGIDPAFLDMVLDSTKDKGEVYHLFDGMGFDLTDEEAAVVFRGNLSGAWMKTLGLSARIDNKIGLRVEFQIGEAAVKKLEDAGYTVECGALLSVGDGAFPRLDEYETKVVFRKADGTRDERFYLSYDAAGVSRVALAVNYNKPTPEMSMLNLAYTGYVVLTTPNGEEIVLYSDCASDKFEYNLFSHYEYLMNSESYRENQFVATVVDNCYEEEEILVDTENGSDESDGKTAPVKTLERAYELIALTLDSPVPVDLTVKIASGTYRLEDKLVLDAKDLGQKYFRITYEGAEGDGTVITTNKVIDNAGFTPVAGTNLYEYQFAKDANDAYPTFRFFYVNGAVQTMAHNGYTRSHEAEADGGQLVYYNDGTPVRISPNGGYAKNSNSGTYYLDNMWVVPYDREGDKLYVHKEAVECLTDEEIASGKVEFHMAIAWYYKSMHINSVDWNDVAGENGEYVAVHFVAADNKGFSSQHGFNSWYYWFENAASFVDEPGEFFYDNTTGKLLYYPLDDVDMESAVLEIPQYTHMLKFVDVNNVTLKNLVFTGNDNLCMENGIYNGGQAMASPGDDGVADQNAAVLFINSAGTKVQDCLFHDLATSALVMHGVTRNPVVEHNRFFTIGSSAITVGARNGTWDEKKNANFNVLITNNYLNDIAWFTRGSIGIYVNIVKTAEISYNTVMNTSYTGISIGWRWGQVSWTLGTSWNVYDAHLHNNYFAGVMSDQSDGGGIYTLGGNVEINYHDYFNFLHDNFFLHTTRGWNGASHTMVMPYYHDGASSNWYTYNNLQIQNPYRAVHTTIYIQNIAGQETYNILAKDNEVVAAYKSWLQYDDGVKLTDEQIEYKVFGTDSRRKKPEGHGTAYNYYSRINDTTRFLEHGGTNVYDMPYELDWIGYPMYIIEEAGSDLCRPDSYAILDEMQAIYDQYYDDLRVAFENS